MRLTPNLSFSNQENRVDYQYRPQNSVAQNHPFENLNIFRMYEKSLSSSFLPIPQLNSLSVNQSIQLAGNGYENLRKKESSKSSVKLESNLKMEITQPTTIMQLDLDYLIPNKKVSTKNVLRNFGNAQNQYILHSKAVQQKLSKVLDDKKEFQAWIRKLELINFKDYQKIWTINGNQSPQEKLFKKLYIKLCWKFYVEESIPYIFSSRLNNDSKKSHILQIYKMLRGIIDPQHFDGFKQ